MNATATPPRRGNRADAATAGRAHAAPRADRRAWDPAGVAPIVAAAALALAALPAGFVGVAPNRLVSGVPRGLWEAAGPGGCLALAMLAAALAGLALTGAAAASDTTPCRRQATLRAGLIAALAAGIVVLLVALAGAAAHAAVAADSGGGGRTRVSLGAAFWVWLSLALLVFAGALRRVPPLPARAALIAALAAALLLLAGAGAITDLSLAREFAVNRAGWVDAAGRHLLLVGGGLLVALPIGGALGGWAQVRPGRGTGAFAVLNLLQTIPSIALFALLIGPLTALANAVPALRGLGFGGIGAFPAIIALALYALLPVARGVEAALRAVPAAAVAAGRGMGMTRLQLLAGVVLPLALPTLLRMLRVVVVQLVGLAVLGALIGAGGLGGFIFRGLGQTAADLVLLGALSTILLAVAAHLLIGALIALLDPEPAR
ncbi:ABC transporter permease subunit [Ancylobacter lacus]|uniref:ABC transporter permease subunit n=1 Tax=Ancylobacter lacus TaxID=2579970 RepID=UPI001BCDEDCF|nr:ABC transporter permease subunit [Ancylobacter lacus]MBS7541048.1 ABC transporter permease subunit [Ancylobacter lacus]